MRISRYATIREPLVTGARARLFAAVVAVTAGAACAGPTRDPIAREPRSRPPFAFPFVDSSVPEAPGQFGGAVGTATGAPAIAYPLDGAMHATNIGAITFQWTRGDETSSVFRIRLDDGAKQYDFYVSCSVDQCLYKLPAAGWLDIAASHRDGQLTATVAGTDGLGGPVYQSAAVRVRFSPQPVNGGLYYWTAPQGSSVGGATYRLLFGAETATPFISPGSATNTFECNGCHSVSRDGSMISFAAADDSSATMAYLRTASTSRPEQATIVPNAMSSVRTRFTTLNTDGSRVLITTFGHIQVLDTRTSQPIDIGAPEELLPAGKLVTHPEWSPSGRRVAFTLYSTRNGTKEITDARPEDGEIVTIDLDEAGRATRLRRIVTMDGPGNMFHVYPSWSPDEQWLVMAATARGMDAYNSPTARLRLASATIERQVCPGPTCYELAAASQGTTVGSTWPKLSPFSHADGQVLFVTFSSRIDYGFTLLNRSAGSRARAQLWMSAIDLRGVQPGGDPSLPPVWLPFQNVTQLNHLPFWTAAVACSETDDGAGCGPNEECHDGSCRAMR